MAVFENSPSAAVGREQKMTDLSSYDKLTVWHSLSFTGITGSGIALASTGILDSIAHQLLLLAVLLTITGIPHGALDYKIAAQLLKPKTGRPWSVMFLAAYLLLMSAVLLAWKINPVASLAAFLCLTALHFGGGDTLTTDHAPGFIRVVDVIGRGTSVLTFPAVFFPEDVMLFFSYLVPESGAVGLVRVLATAAPLAALSMACSIVWYLTVSIRSKDIVSLSRALELIAITLAFCLMPALFAFTIYFSLLHSVRHLFYVAGSRNANDMVKSFCRTFNQSIPVTLVTIGLGVGAYFALAADFDIASLTKVIFIGIASVTYPHVTVIFLAQHGGVLKKKTRLLSV
jgi:Brp/Blh family beta-carotene 15,15'-monooxygenase